jgi:hypothetical protein
MNIIATTYPERQVRMPYGLALIRVFAGLLLIMIVTSVLWNVNPNSEIETDIPHKEQPTQSLQTSAHITVTNTPYYVASVTQKN